MPGSGDPLEDQFAKCAQAKKGRVTKNELNRLQNLALAHKMQLPRSAGLHSMGHQSKEELGCTMQVAKVSTTFVLFQECLPKEKTFEELSRRESSSWSSGTLQPRERISWSCFES